MFLISEIFTTKLVTEPAFNSFDISITIPFVSFNSLLFVKLETLLNTIFNSSFFLTNLSLLKENTCVNNGITFDILKLLLPLTLISIV